MRLRARRVQEPALGQRRDLEGDAPTLAGLGVGLADVAGSRAWDGMEGPAVDLRHRGDLEVPLVGSLVGFPASGLCRRSCSAGALRALRLVAI